MVQMARASLAKATGPAFRLEDKLAFLADGRNLPGYPASVEARETHMSWVFLTPDRVYKLKKPVRFPYLDFSTAEHRAAVCRAEDRLNRRLAPDIYLGVLPLTAGPSGLALGGEGPPVDWLVVMRRLNEAESLQALLLGHDLRMDHVARIAAALRAFYRRARPAPTSPERYLNDWGRASRMNRHVLSNPRFKLPLGPIGRILGVQERFLTLHGAQLAARVRQGRIVEAHGDLRPEHIWPGHPVSIIDCLEFDDHLRALDPLDEIAFLHLECEQLGARWAGEAIRRRLAARLGEDRRGLLFLFYRSQRALLRARLSIAHLYDPTPRMPDKWPRQARAYLRLAARDAAQLERGLRMP